MFFKEETHHTHNDAKVATVSEDSDENFPLWDFGNRIVHKVSDEVFWLSLHRKER